MKTKNIKSKIKDYFLLNPTSKLRVRQIERVVNVPLPSVIRYTKELEQENILQSLKIANINVYTANRNSEEFLLEKKLYNLRHLFESNLIDYLRQEYSNPLIFVFGSYATGEDLEESDIDIYVETLKKQVFKLGKYEKILNRKIQVFNYSNIKKISNKELSNNILNGIKLNGFIEVF